jgi:hypothetical protein
MSQNTKDEEKCEFCEKVKHAFNSFLEAISHKQPKSLLKKYDAEKQE